MKIGTLFIGIFLLTVSCKENTLINKSTATAPYIYVLGIAQDAGYPQAGCEKECCQRVYSNIQNKKHVSSIALIDPVSNESWIFDASPDFKEQLKLLSNHIEQPGNLPNGIFLTHAHMGHYTGLLDLGREAMGTKELPVFAMPKMKAYLETNGPWSQLVSLKNIELIALQKDISIALNNRISITPIQVPHRDEYSETIGFLINANSKKVLFIPDIDKWEKWDRSIKDYIRAVDVAILDGTFFRDGEIKGRSMSEIPHPFVEESMALFQDLSVNDKKKVYFTHFNHTNPLLISGSEAQQSVFNNGFKIASQASIILF